MVAASIPSQRQAATKVRRAGTRRRTVPVARRQDERLWHKFTPRKMKSAPRWYAEHIVEQDKGAAQEGGEDPSQDEVEGHERIET